MSYPEYQADLQHIHESEVYGRAAFATAARVTRDPARKRKWLALEALEAQTLRRYLDYMESTHQQVIEPRGWATKGHVEGAVLGLMPWRVAMKLVADATVPFQKKFLRLKTHAEGSELAFFAYVYAHEKAIEAFARKELARDAESLHAVESLLAGQG
ncbi:MAG TPA: hypothetical protein DCY18_04070 [Thauera sp.]|nr:hypothetical protein [Thauera sp.]